MTMIEGLPLYSERFRDSLLATQIVEAIARADGWESLDDCFAEGQSLVETYIAYADA